MLNILPIFKAKTDLIDLKDLFADNLIKISANSISTHSGVFKYTYDFSTECVKKGEYVGVLASQKDSKIGTLEAINEKYSDVGILSIDSHGSYINILDRCLATKISAICSSKNRLSDPDVEFFTNCYVSWLSKNDGDWQSIAYDIIMSLPNNIWVSIEYSSMLQLARGFLEELLNSFLLCDKKLIGFDFYSTFSKEALQHVVDLFRLSHGLNLDYFGLKCKLNI